MYWNWVQSGRNEYGEPAGDENTVVCEICLEERGPISEYWTEEGLREWMEEHLRRDHNVEVSDSDPTHVNVLNVWEIREREIIGYEYSQNSRDCDGEHGYYGNYRLREDETWSQFIGRQVTFYPPEGFEIHHGGLAFSWGGPTDEGYSGTHIKAIFSHEEYKLDERPSQYDQFAEAAGY